MISDFEFCDNAFVGWEDFWPGKPICHSCKNDSASELWSAVFFYYI